MQSKVLLSVLALCGWGLLATHAQDLNLDLFESLRIRSIGPAGMSGRVTSIDVHPDQPDIIYIGTASGGAWKSTSGGINWEPIFDDQPVASVGAIAVSDKNPNIVWAGTGEGNPRNSANAGRGIFKSLDGGETWMDMGLHATKTIHRIIIHPDNPDVVYAGAQGSQWGPNPERGVFRTRDGGKTWDKILYVDENTGIADLVVNPNNPNHLIAAMWEYGRQPWTFNSGGKGSGLHVTFDGGDSWTRITQDDGLPKGILGRMGIAFAKNKNNLVYALVEAEENGLYKSTNGGRDWSLVSKKNIGNRPFYYSEIYVDPVNENRIWNLWSYVSKSEDGGKSFETILDYGAGVHPDHHAFWISPDGRYLINGNDGGLNISRDGGETWRFITNLPLAQFYHIDHDMDIPYNVAGGMQDNGSWVGPSQALKSGGITAADWQEVYFGDGFDVSFQPDNNRYVYAMSQGGNLGRIDRTTGAGQFIKPVHPDGETILRYNWNAAFAQDPFEPHTIYYGSQFVHKSKDLGQHWEIISPDLTTNDPEKQKQDESGGLTIDATQAENNTTILAITPSPVDRNVLWVGTDDGNLQVSRDGGTTWTNVAKKMPGFPAGAWIPVIIANNKNAGEAFVVVNDYRRNDWRPMAYHTADYGQTFRRIADEKQVSGHVWSIVQDPIEPNLLFLGTDFGLYFSLNKGGNWQKWDKNFPSVPVSDLKIHPREHDLIVGTFGRAAWIMDDIRPLRELAGTNGKALNDEEFMLFDAGDGYLAEYRSYQGIRFTADAEFQGQNRWGGVMLNYWVQPDTLNDRAEAKRKNMDVEEYRKWKKEEAKKDKDKKQPKKVYFKVVDNAGDTIRTFSRKFEPGMNRTVWGMNKDGYRFPSRREPREDADPPGGGSVLPGVYTIVAEYGDMTDATTVTVHPDPRLPYSAGQYDQQAQLEEEFTGVVKAATDAFDRLQDARDMIDLVNKMTTHADEDMQDSLKQRGKDMTKIIDSLELLYMMPEDIKGIQRNPNNLTGALWSARRYIGQVQGPPSQMAEVTLNRARMQTREVVEQVNDFLTGAFTDYRREVEAVKLEMFKDLEPVKLE